MEKTMSNEGFTEKQEAQIREIIADEVRNDPSSMSRRGVLGALGVGALGIGTGSYAASQTASASQGSGSIGTEQNPLDEIYVDNLYQNTDHILAESVTTDELHNTVFAAPGDDYQSLVDDAAGGTLYFLEGTHEVSEPITVSHDNTTVVIPLGAELVGVGGFVADEQGPIQAVGEPNNWLENIKIVGRGAIKNGDWQDRVELIEIDYVDNWLVSGIRLYNSAEDGLDVDHATNGVASDIIAFGCDKSGIHISVSTDSNIVYGCITGDSGEDGIDQGYTEGRNLYVGNISYEDRDGFRTYEDSSVWINNAVYNPDRYGFYLTGKGCHIISGLMVDSPGSSGIHCESNDNIFSNCILNNVPDESGVWIEGDHNQISNFKIHGGSNGVALWESNENIVSNIRAENQNLSSVICYQTAHRNIVSNVISVEPGEHAVRIWNGAEDNVIQDVVAVNPTDGKYLDNGVRTTLEGLGYNDGDPSTTGEWNGNGYEGVRIWDTANNLMYDFADGAWR